MFDDEQPNPAPFAPDDAVDDAVSFGEEEPLTLPEPEEPVFPGPSGPLVSVPAGTRVIMIVSRGPSPALPAMPVGMPDVTGEKQGNALLKLQDAGLAVQVLHDHHDHLPRGYVIGQYPLAGDGVQPGSDAVLLVSSGRAKLPAPPVPLPPIIGLEHNLAADRLSANGLVSRVVYDHDPVAAPGMVLAQIPSEESLARPVRKRAGVGWIVTLIALVSIAAIAGAIWFFNRPSTVPNIVGMNQAQAEQTVRLAGFRVGSVVTSQTPNPADVGNVVEQSPAPGVTAPSGSVVSLVVSGGQLLVSVPNVTGKTEGQAVKDLQTAGLLFSFNRAFSSTVPSGSVVSQAPAAGQRVPSGTTVGLTLSMGAQLVTVPGVTGQQKESAMATLRTTGLLARVVSNYDTTTPSGQVMLQSPTTGSLAPPGSIVGLVVSRGTAASGTPVATVPDVSGKTSAKAQKLIKAAKLKSVLVMRDRSGFPKGTVVQQLPDVNAILPRNSWVILFVASGT